MLLLTLTVLAMTACTTNKTTARPCENTSPHGPVPALPAAFPTLDGVTLEAPTMSGPSTMVVGASTKTLQEAFESAKAAFATGGYSVTKSEKDDHDAEVGFSGNCTTGQVALDDDTGNTRVRITIRPGS